MRRRKHIRRKEIKKRNKRIVLTCILAVFLLTVGYAAFQTTININIKGHIIKCELGKVYEFNFKAEAQEFKIPCSGKYKVELWGAEGGGNSEHISGKGGYVSGNIDIKKNQTIYIYTGENPKYTSTRCNSTNPNQSFNGTTRASCASGGGATDIRLLKTDNWYDFTSLKTRIIVAGGGGGAIYNGFGGSSGGLTGYDGIGLGNNSAYEIGTGGAQTSLYFGLTKFSSTVTTTGGAGYYNGNSGWGGNAGGGSSFISGHEGCDAISENSTEDNIIHTGQSIHYSALYFTDTVMIDGQGYKWTDHKLEDLGQVGMPSHDGTSTMLGNEGNGFAKITLISYKNN